MSQTNESVYVWNINGHSFEIDLQDVEATERYEAAFAKMDEEEKNLPQDGKASVRLKAYCAMFRNLFDNLFGHGASDKIFGERDNARVMAEIYENFLDFVSGQQATAVETQNRIINRYSPNRAQRREAARK